MARFLIVLGLVILVAGLLWAVSEPDRAGAAARRPCDRAEKCNDIFPADDLSSSERAVQPGLVGRQPLRWRSAHRTPRVARPAEVGRERFGAGATFFWASNIPCKCASAFSMS